MALLLLLLLYAKCPRMMMEAPAIERADQQASGESELKKNGG